MSHETREPGVVLKKDRRQSGERRALARRPGGRRASDLDTFASEAVSWPAGVLLLWPDLPTPASPDRGTIH